MGRGPQLSRVRGTGRLFLLLLSCVAGAAILYGRQRSGPGATPPSQRPPVVFEQVTQQRGLDFVHTNGASAEKHMVETMGSGGLFFDYDNDGWLDIFLVDGGSLEDRQGDSLARAPLGPGGLFFDYNNDGWLDIFLVDGGSLEDRQVAARARHRLFHNRGNGT